MRLPAAAEDLAGRVFHLIGVGGAGMSVVAQILVQRGASVTGSDAGGGEAFDQLRRQGVDVRLGHDAANLPPDATVVVSTAIKDSNPELLRARERGQAVIHRSEALALAARDRAFIAVAGAHGKTTTSAMLAQALTTAGQDPSFAVGGVVRSLRTGAHLGGGRAFVAEADESDRSFLNYMPAIEIVTNIEPDHLDNYGTPEAFAEAFVSFSKRLEPGGLLIACADDSGARRLARTAAAAGTRVTTYGTTAPADIPDGPVVGAAHVRVAITSRHAGGTRAVLTRWQADADVPSLGPLSLESAIPGDHVVLNAAGAWEAGYELGVEPQAMADALSGFAGTGRRFEERGEKAGVRVIDDYAHHPTEIETLLAAAREVAEARHGRVIALFQPHLFSRTRNFAERFGAALAAAEHTIVTGVYPAREAQADFPDVTGQLVVDHTAGQARYIAEPEAAARAAAEVARPGDLILTIGAGDVTRLGSVILDALAARCEPDQANA
ncbi:UDP-N-acetylmuramate--L-alanine ligase [Actinomyces sp.]|uniref:UDP-N-acetylmuramate--L-alanine ligase n=1 Tax=Actinomyces sp. TaxID=29317 RepID=UPI0026DA812D|nr:UDP-N-acetylmuramate--L-alanine ligase [Actinomyces sp.]MDO4899600.1 UDP-N-acetylmuramate--L-alanine ligase [Actinomyces sp.]